METQTHERLKRWAAALLIDQGYLAVATEVRCPISRYRVDVAGYADRPADAGPISPGPLFEAIASSAGTTSKPSREVRTVVIECKQSRGDFLRHRREVQALLARRDRLDAARERYEQTRLPVEEPHLRQTGSALFAELEQWDFTASRSAGYRRIIRRLRRVERQLYGETKFSMIARYRLADRLYIAAPAGLIQPDELPAGWGLLECPKRALRREASIGSETAPVRVSRAAPSQMSPARFRQRLLRNIAIAATRMAFTAPGRDGSSTTPSRQTPNGPPGA